MSEIIFNLNLRRINLEQHPVNNVPFKWPKWFCVIFSISFEVIFSYEGIHNTYIHRVIHKQCDEDCEEQIIFIFWPVKFISDIRKSTNYIQYNTFYNTYIPSSFVIDSRSSFFQFIFSFVFNI